MNVTCSDCHSIFRVDPAKVPAGGVRARCSVCGAVFVVESEAGSHAFAETADSDAPVAAAEAQPAHDPVSGIEAGSSSTSPVVEDRPAPAVVEAAEHVVREAPGGTPLATPPLAAATEARPNRPFNPFLSNTPELRARRLARALVSDLVAYNPQKREQGLRDGTLRQLFRDEIRKSWEEYVEQVGANVAESTPHFQDALNDVLAGGRRVF